MRLIIAGCRDKGSFADVASGFDEFLTKHIIGMDDEVDMIVSGCAPGIDTLGMLLAEEHDIPVKKFPADWSMGKHAGKVRNIQMAGYADALLAIWDGWSPGTAHMIATMARLKKPIHIYEVR